MRTVGLLLSIVGPPLILAQSALDSWDNLKQIRTGLKIEVVDTKMKPVQGNFVSYSEEAILLRLGQDQMSIPRASVVSVKNREGPRRARNAWLGMAIGAAGGAAVGAMGGRQAYHEEGEVFLSMLVWTPIGAGIGAGVGAALPSRQVTIYRVKNLPTR
jgi:hypothetical protein